MKRYLQRIVVGALLAALGVVWHAPSALSHALPERANPPIEGVVPSAPRILEIWFSEEVDTTQLDITVIGPEGNQVDEGDAAVDLYDPERRRATVTLASGLQPGVYIVQWHSASALDKDAVDGSYQFLVDPSATPTALSTPAPSSEPSKPLPDATPTAAESDDYDFDQWAFGVSIGAGVLAAVAIGVFWRFVRPRKKAELTEASNDPDTPN